jgi:virginiamycin B lyase
MPYGITVGPDGNLWFTELSMRIGRITLQGRITEFKLPGVNHVPGDIVAGGDGALWFLEPDTGLLGHITTDGHLAEFPLPHAACHQESPASEPLCEVVYLAAGPGPDGTVWLSEPWRGAVGYFEGPDHFTEVPLPPAAKQGLGALTVGPDGTVWFSYAGGIGCLSR